MAETFSIRINKDTPPFEEIDAAAERLGMSRNQLIIEGINIMCTFDTKFYGKMKNYADTFRLPIPLIMQNMLIKRLAEDYAKDQVWGFTGKVMTEFSFNERGPITGGELFKMLVEEATQKEIRDKVRMLEDQFIKLGLPLPEDEVEFYQAHKPKPVIKDTEEEIIRKLHQKYGEPVSIAYWEGEMTEEEAIETIKAKKRSVRDADSK